MTNKPTSSTQNIYFANVAKTLVIFCILLGHLPIPHDLYAFMNCYLIPFFFIISGYLLSIDAIPFKKLFVKKTKTIMLPYYLFAVITFLFWYFFGRYYGDDALQDVSPVQYATGALLGIPSRSLLGFNLPIWFLPTLFCAEIIYYGILRFFKKRAWIVCIFCFLIGVIVKIYYPWRLPFGLDVSLFALLFFQVGRWIREGNWIEKYIANISFVYRILLVIGFCGLTYFISQINQANGAISMVDRIFNNYMLYFISAFSGVLFILYLSYCLPESSLFNFYGRNTIILLGFHLMVFSIIKGLQVFVLGISLELTEGLLWVEILYVILTFVLLAPVIYLVNKYTPFLLGRKKGIL